MSNEVLLENVKTWLDIDNQIRALQKQIKERRKLKKDLTASLVQIMKTNEIEQLKKNNHKSLIRISELEAEKKQLLLELNNSSKENKIRFNQIQTSTNNIENNIRKNNKLIPLFKNDLNKYKVELHRKFAIPIACIIFILIQ